MPAYLIAEHIVIDTDRFREYGARVIPMIAKCGGSGLTRGGAHRVLETSHFVPDRVSIFEFPDMATLNGWYDLADFRPLIALRRSAADMRKDMMIAIDGA